MSEWIIGFYHKYGPYFLHLFINFAFLFAIFTLLTYVFAINRSQPIFRRGLITDIIYFFIGPSFYLWAETCLRLFLVACFYSAATASELLRHGFPPLGTMPQWIQIPVILLIYDFLRYWVHRASHHIPLLWRFHAVHHSSLAIDWLSVARFHPVNIILQNSIPMALILLVGFSPAALLSAGVLDWAVGIFEHSNLSWTFGPLRYVIVNPVYHRWHHTHPHEGGNKNFAGWFPFIDVIFGTFYMPKDKIPTVFGTANDKIPENFLGQLIYPFRTSRPITNE